MDAREFRSEWEFSYFNVNRFFSFGLGLTHAANFWMAVGAVGNVLRIDRFPFLSRNLGHSKQCLHGADMRQLWVPTTISPMA